MLKPLVRILFVAGLVALLCHHSSRPEWVGRFSSGYLFLLAGYVLLGLATIGPRAAARGLTRRTLRAHLGDLIAYSVAAWVPLLASDALDLRGWDVWSVDVVSRGMMGVAVAGACLAAAITGAGALLLDRRHSPNGGAPPDVAFHVPFLLFGFGLWAALPPAGDLHRHLPLWLTGALLSMLLFARWRVLRPTLAWSLLAATGVVLWAWGTCLGRAGSLSGDKLLLVAFSSVGVCGLLAAQVWGRGRPLRNAAAVIVAVTLFLAARSTVRVRPIDFPSARGAAEEPAPANVILLVVDTLRADHLTPWGQPKNTCPFLTDLIRSDDRTTTFFEAWTAATWTRASLRAALSLESRQPTVRNPEAKPTLDAWMLAESFAAKGYRTIGITANPMTSGPGFEQGFENYSVLDWYGRSAGSVALSTAFRLEGALEAHDLAERMHVDKVPGRSVVGRGLDWLDRHRAGPFFMYLHIVDPHAPYHRSRLADRYVREPLTLGALSRHAPGDTGLWWMRTQPAFADLVTRYDEEIAVADAALRSLFAGLARLDLDKNTLVVVMGDHGEEFLEHDGFMHGHDVYPELSHVPLVIRWPAQPEFARTARRIDTPVSLADVPHTLADYMHLPARPAPGDGPAPGERRSLRTLIEGGSEHRPVVVEAYRKGLCIFAYREDAVAVRLSGSPAASSMEDLDALLFDASSGRPRTPGSVPDAEALVARARDATRGLWQSWRAWARLQVPRNDEARADEGALERLRGIGYLE